ncbi:hypothetical protein GPECTOR_10g846 [Gonium pectorale]|uniref:Uncharacterized protein n=1 Tax=Gonium pectorale TaxID=33097 RepID=A0A150GQV6_GONPE|nr:hypothetical protein GPECTOR_10g846 [Gonium pectorale]|eukprot:KXZ52215.1 hypothetical protein GPECTOR_10g846 [Gonium pectorale]
MLEILSDARSRLGYNPPSAKLVEPVRVDKGAVSEEILKQAFWDRSLLQQICNEVKSQAANKELAIASSELEHLEDALTRVDDILRFGPAEQLTLSSDPVVVRLGFLTWLHGFLGRLEARHLPASGQWTRIAEVAMLRDVGLVSPTLAMLMRQVPWARCSTEQKLVALERYLQALFLPDLLDMLGGALSRECGGTAQGVHGLFQDIVAGTDELLKELSPAVMQRVPTSGSSGEDAAVVSGYSKLLSAAAAQLAAGAWGRAIEDYHCLEELYLDVVAMRQQPCLAQLPGIYDALKMDLARQSPETLRVMYGELLAGGQRSLMQSVCQSAGLATSSSEALDPHLHSLLNQYLDAVVPKSGTPQRWEAAAEQLMLQRLEDSVSYTLGQMVRRVAWAGCSREQLCAALGHELAQHDWQAVRGVFQRFVAEGDTPDERRWRRRAVWEALFDTGDMAAAAPMLIAAATK